MTKYEAAVISAYTGIMLGEFYDTHKFIEEVMERPVYTHELANEAVWKEIKEKSKRYFINLRVE